MEARVNTPTCLVLWDVDHTLISTGGVGREAFSEAFRRATGLELVEMADPSGLTEGDIFRKTAASHGIANAEALFPAFADSLAQAYESRIDQLRSRGAVLPGASAALRSVGRLPRTVQGVLTGNLREVARVKLTAFDLEGFVEWRLSAFAEDGSERAELVAAARARACAVTGNSYHGSRTVLIGDTINDVQTALKTEAAVIAVATGHFSAADLHAAGAEHVLTSLDDPRFVGMLNDLLTSA
jgi:phosphoglycolate phosphatase-like HAD superfamily hydrolase